MNAFAGIRPKFPRGVKTRPPLAFFPGVCSAGYLFSSGGSTPNPPANFYIGPNVLYSSAISQIYTIMHG